MQASFSPGGEDAADSCDSAEIVASKLFALITSPAICGSRAGDCEFQISTVGRITQKKVRRQSHGLVSNHWAV
jgi:hypothetical protein